MKFSYHEKRRTNLHFQRNILFGACSILLLITLLQSIFIFFRSEKIILLPPETKQSFWVEGNAFAPSYLEEQGLYFAHLILDISESNVLSQGEILLRSVDSEEHGVFKAKLLEDEKRLKKDHLALHFTPVECDVYPESLSLDVSGDLSSYVGSKKVTSHRETYRVEFTAQKGRLFLKKFTLLKTDQTNGDQP
jgi:conjugal transfer pilus assembly protein TraE